MLPDLYLFLPSLLSQSSSLLLIYNFQSRFSNSRIYNERHKKEIQADFRSLGVLKAEKLRLHQLLTEWAEWGHASQSVKTVCRCFNLTIELSPNQGATPSA